MIDVNAVNAVDALHSSFGIGERPGRPMRCAVDGRPAIPSATFRVWKSCPGARQAVSRSLSRRWLSSKPDRVKVALAYLIDPVEQLVDVIVLGVEVASCKRVVAAGRESADEFRSELRRRPWCVVRERARSQLRLHQAGLKKKTGIRPASSFASISP